MAGPKEPVASLRRSPDAAAVVHPIVGPRCRVIASEGKAVAGVHVNAQPENPPQDGRPVYWRGASTDNDGRFELVGLDEDTFTLNVSAQRGFQELKKPGVRLGTDDIVLQIAVGMSISGVLVDESGDPRANENLSARRILEKGEPQTMQTWANVHTGTDGSFEFTGLGPGNYVIERQMYRNDGKQVEDRDLVLQGGGKVAAGSSNVRLTLSGGTTISGIIVDVSGKGAQGVGINARLNGNYARSGTTKGDGTFEIKGLADDAEYVLEVRGGKYRMTRSEPILAGTSEVKLVVEEGLSASGRIVDAKGDGMAKQGLSLQHLEDGEKNAWVNADDDGNFVAQGLDEGTYKVRASSMAGMGTSGVSGGGVLDETIPCDGTTDIVRELDLR